MNTKSHNELARESATKILASVGLAEGDVVEHLDGSCGRVKIVTGGSHFQCAVVIGENGRRYDLLYADRDRAIKLAGWKKAARSYYVETGAMEDTQLDREVRFATRDEAEKALRDLLSMRNPTDRNGRPPSTEESREPATTTYKDWAAGGW